MENAIKKLTGALRRAASSAFKAVDTRPKVWRQGDVFIISTVSVPDDAKPRKPVLAEGEVTGHAHRLADVRRAGVFGVKNGPFEELFLHVTEDDATVVHEEHHSVTVPRGSYIVRIQREYHPQEIRRVVD